MLGLIGKKIGMTRVFQEDGKSIPVTVLECKPNEVVCVRNEDKDGYSALALGANPLKKPRKTKKHFSVREFKIDETSDYKTGSEIKVDIFNEVERVKITSISKGKGFQGGIKRHNFSRGPETHGSHHHREIGSIGACASPGRVAKGKKMPGRMGGAQVTVRQVKIVSVDEKNNLIAIKGAVPGPNGGTVRIEIEQ